MRACLFLFLGMLLAPSVGGWPSLLWAQALDLKRDGVRAVITVSVPSSSVGTQVCDYIDNECSVQVATGAAVSVCFAPVNAGTTCAAGFTTPGGRCFPGGAGWTYLPREDGWIGQVCALLASGSTAVNVQVIRR